MSAKNKLISNTGALFALQLANYILPFLIIPLLTRALGVSLYGVVAFGLAMVQISCIITDFGFNLSATRQIASHQDDRLFVRKVVGAVHICKSFLLVPVVVFFVFFLYFQDQKYGEYSTFFWFLLIPIAGQTFQPIWFFQGMERMGFITLFVVLARGSYVVLAMLWVSVPEDYVWVAIANGIAQVVGAIFAVLFMVRLGYSPAWPGWTFTKEVFSESIQYFWSRAAVSIYTAGGAFYLGLISSSAMVAYYSAAEQLYKGAQAIFQPVSQALFPYMSRNKNIDLFRKILCAFIVLSLAGVLVAVLTGKWFLSFLFGVEYVESYSILMLFMCAFVLTTPSVLLGYPFLAAFGDARSANVSVIFGGCIQVLLLLLIWRLGWASGEVVASSIVLVEAFVLFYRSVKARKIAAKL